jgi:hypothetical protein
MARAVPDPRRSKEYGFSIMRIRLVICFLALALGGCASASIPQGDIYYQDDFSNSGSGWDRAAGEDGVTDYSAGMYRIFSATSNYYMWATAHRSFPNDVRIEVNVTKKAGADQDVFGVLCRYRNEKSFYILMISGDGQAGIAKRTSDAVLTMLSGGSMKSNPSIHPGPATNLLRADCIGSKLALYANDTLVASAADPDFTGGDAGLWLGTYDQPGTDLYFDDFVVRKP